MTDPSPTLEGPGAPAGGSDGSGFPREDWADLARYAPDRRPVALDLSDNTSLWGPHPAAVEVVAGARADVLARYPSVYADDLRGGAARAWGVPEASVVTGCGSDDLLDSALRAVTAGGGAVSFPAPTFGMVGVFARMNGLEARPVPWNEAVTYPAELLRDDPAAIYLCSPNNPTGAELEPRWLRVLLAERGPAGPPVILDEAYADFAARSFLAEAPDIPRILVLRTLSKAYGLAGLRVGLGVGDPEVVREVEKSRGPYKVSRLAEAAAVAALDDGKGWVPAVVEEAVRSRRRLRGELEARGLAPLPSAGNFLLVPVGDVILPASGAPVPDVPGGAAGPAGLLTAALRKRGVAVRPFPGLPGVGDAIRVTVAPWPLMEQFLAALDRVLDGPDGPGRDEIEEDA